jgi:hypothetical protein
MDLASHLTSLESSGLISPDLSRAEIGFHFRHALIQEAAYHSLVKRDRQRLHLAAGEAIETLYSTGGANEIAPLLARHFAEGGATARAIRYYDLAGKAAADRFANAEAIQHFTHLIELGEQAAEAGVIVGAYLARGHALELSSQDAAALKNYEALEAWAKGRGNRPAELAALTARGTIYVKASVQRNQSLGYELAQQAMALARELNDEPAEARAWWNLSQLYQTQSRLSESVEAGEKALVLARAHGPSELVAYVLTDLNRSYALAGQLDKSQMALAEARVLWRELGTLNMLSDNLSSGALTAVLRARYDEALSLSDEALTVARAIGNLWNQSYARLMIDLVYFERGELAQALEVAGQCQAFAEQAGFAYGLTQSGFNLAMMFAYLGVLPSAFEAANQLRARADAEAGQAHAWPLAEALAAWLHLRNGDLAAAQAGAAFARLPEPDDELAQWFIVAHAFVACFRAELALAEGRPEQALKTTAAAARHFQKVGLTLFLTDMFYWQGRAFLATGQTAEAQAVFMAAQREARERGSRRMLWPTLVELARLAETRGEFEGARALWGEAGNIIEYIAAHAGAHATTFRARAEVREVMERVAADFETDPDKSIRGRC